MNAMTGSVYDETLLFIEIFFDDKCILYQKQYGRFMNTYILSSVYNLRLK